MAYLIQNDFKKLIQSENLAQILGNDFSILSTMGLTAVAEAVSFLVQRYITTQEFQDLPAWSVTNIYKATNRVYLDAPAYNAGATYVLGTVVLQAGQIYICSTAIVASEAFTLGHWTLKGNQYDIFYAAFPQPLFQLTGTYRVGDFVYWNNRTYKCQIATVSGSHSADLQAVYSQQIPFSNAFPDAIGQNQWLVQTPNPYTVPASTDILNTTYWTKGDNRNQQLVNYVIDIALYHIHSRIAPRNIPDLRVKRYDDAIKWLKMAGEGKITADLPVIQPKSGGRIRWGGNVRTQTGY